MVAVGNLDCASCHNNSKVMQASADRGKQLPLARFHLNPKMVNLREVTLRLPRPTDGYTKTFASFSEGHPPFQLQRENVRDNNVLRFNHQRHLNSRDIPPTKSGKLGAASAISQSRTAATYSPSVSRRIARMSLAAVRCEESVPASARRRAACPVFRARCPPIRQARATQTRPDQRNESQQFAVQQVRQLLTQFPNAEELERSVFFTVDPYKTSQQNDASSHAKYTGCAFCHEVKQAAGLSYPTAEITKPTMIERWLPHAHFSHAQHGTVASCRECHVGAKSSRLTSDVLIPTKENCVRCHSPGGVARKASECSACHLYHSPDQPPLQR
jgi:hypothetical protein